MDLQNIIKSPLVQIIAIVALIISAVLIGYYTNKKEKMTDVASTQDKTPSAVKQVDGIQSGSDNVLSVEPRVGAPKEIKPEDLLPPSDATGFNTTFPSGSGDVANKNFLIAGHNIGINTVSSSLKNANLQLRSDPYIPRSDVGPWNNSTIMASDLTNRKTLEIGN